MNWTSCCMNEEPDGSLQQPVARAAISGKAKRSKKCISKPAPKKKPGRTSGQTKNKAMVIGIELGSLSTDESNGVVFEKMESIGVCFSNVFTVQSSKTLRGWQWRPKAGLGNGVRDHPENVVSEQWCVFYPNL
jgi:hypothetical protein